MKKAIIIPILIIFILFPIKLFAEISRATHEEKTPAGDLISKNYVVGKSNEYIFARKTGHDDDFEFKQSGLYTNDEKRELIYSLPDFYEETLFISEDGFTVMVFYDSCFGYDNLNQSFADLYKNGKKIKQNMLYSLYSFPFELQPSHEGYYWIKGWDLSYFKNPNTHKIKFTTYNGRIVTLNTLTGKMTKTPSYFEIIGLGLLVCCCIIVLIIALAKLTKNKHKKVNKDNM